jgi:hypothetical protein
VVLTTENSGKIHFHFHGKMIIEEEDGSLLNTPLANQREAIRGLKAVHLRGDRSFVAIEDQTKISQTL